MRIALATVGTTGDVVPFVALGARADGGRARRHRVSWELHREAFAGRRERVLRSGTSVSRQEIADTASRAAAAGSPLAQVAVLRDFHLAARRRPLPAAAGRSCRGHDLVVLHGIHTLAEAAARDAGLAWASAAFDPVLLPTATAPPAGMPSLGPLNRLEWWVLDRMLRRQDKPLRAALEAAGSALGTRGHHVPRTIAATAPGRLLTAYRAAAGRSGAKHPLHRRLGRPGAARSPAGGR